MGFSNTSAKFAAVLAQEQLAPFMIKWLSQNSKTPAAAAFTEGINVLSELKVEMEKLQEEVKDLEKQVPGWTTMVVSVAGLA